VKIAAQRARQCVAFHVIDAVEAIEERSAGRGNCGEKRRDRAWAWSGSGAVIDPHQRLVPDGKRSPALARRRAGVAREFRQEIGQPHEAPCCTLVERRAGADDRRQRICLLEAHDIFEQLSVERPRSQPIDPRREPCDVP
jgi:hypothetical protein